MHSRRKGWGFEVLWYIYKPVLSPGHLDLDLVRCDSNSERPMTVRGFLSFGGSEIPSKAVDDFHGLRPYIPECRRTPTPSLHAASIRKRKPSFRPTPFNCVTPASQWDPAFCKRLKIRTCGSRTCKPNSVRLAAGRSFLWAAHYCAAQATYPEVVAHRAGTLPREARRLTRKSLPIWSCSVWGLPCPPHYCDSGALLPHLFTLTPALPPGRYILCGTFR
jgi:hypothetical protein